MRPSLDSRGAPGRAAAGRRFMRLVLKFVALGSSWPLGHPDYRTGVSAKERLRKEVSGGRKPMASSRFLNNNRWIAQTLVRRASGGTGEARRRMSPEK